MASKYLIPLILSCITAMLLLCSCAENSISVNDAEEQAAAGAAADTNKKTDGFKAAVNEKNAVGRFIDTDNPITSEKEAMSEDEMKINLEKSCEGSILFWEFCDYDNDGENEAAALVGNEENHAVSGVLALCSSSGGIYVINDSVMCEKVFTFSAGSKKFICLSYITTNDRSLIYEVGSGFAAEAPVSGVGLDFTVLDECNFTIVHSEFDSLYMGGEPAGGHTYKKYYFFYDEQTEEFCEYGGTEITVEDLKKFKNSNGALETVENMNGIITSVLKRKNGIININYYTEAQEMEGMQWQHNLTLCYEGDRIYEVSENEGVYLPALVPQIAVYQ